MKITSLAYYAAPALANWGQSYYLLPTTYYLFAIPSIASTYNPFLFFHSLRGVTVSFPPVQSAKEFFYLET